MLNKNRKGVSEVVANVLIVLLVIVGIAVIWSVVKPTVDKGAQGIKTGSECLSLSLEPVSCALSVSGQLLPAGSASVMVKRNAGSGVFEAVELVFEDASGRTQRVVPATAVTSTNLGELSTTSLSASGINFGGATLLAPTKVNVAIRAGGQLCPPLSQPVACS